MNSFSKRFIFLSILISILLAPLIFSGGGLNINVPDIEPIPEIVITPEQIIAANIASIQTSITEINTVITKINTAKQQATTAQATTAQITQINTALTTTQTAKTTAETALQQAQQLTSDTQRAIELQTTAQTAVETANAQLVIANNVVSTAQAAQTIFNKAIRDMTINIELVPPYITKINTAKQQATTAQATTAQIAQINTALTTAQTALAAAKATTDITDASILTTARTAVNTALSTARAQLVIANNIVSTAKATQTAATQAQAAAAQAAIDAATPATTSTLTVTTNQPTECATGSICKKIGRKGGSIYGLYSGSICYNIINNNNNNDYFVPLNSVLEFNAFITNKPSGVTVTSCQSSGREDKGDNYEATPPIEVGWALNQKTGELTVTYSDGTNKKFPPVSNPGAPTPWMGPQYQGKAPADPGQQEITPITEEPTLDLPEIGTASNDPAQQEISITPSDYFDKGEEFGFNE